MTNEEGVAVPEGESEGQVPDRGRDGRRRKQKGCRCGEPRHHHGPQTPRGCLGTYLKAPGPLHLSLLSVVIKVRRNKLASWTKVTYVIVVWCLHQGLRP